MQVVTNPKNLRFKNVRKSNYLYKKNTQSFVNFKQFKIMIMQAYSNQECVTQVTGYPNRACPMPVSKKLRFYCFNCRIFPFCFGWNAKGQEMFSFINESLFQFWNSFSFVPRMQTAGKRVQYLCVYGHRNLRPVKPCSGKNLREWKHWWIKALPSNLKFYHYWRKAINWFFLLQIVLNIISILFQQKCTYPCFPLFFLKPVFSLNILLQQYL